jgi:integrative and conjugative element protein (TIGR02256 family)
MMTHPQDSDIRSRLFYTRNVAGHLKAARDIWESSGGLVGYLGEWHSHPQRSPTPSSRDLLEAKKLAKANRGQKILSLIIGTAEACVFIAEERYVSDLVSFAFP